jgi:acyl-CoA thioesterase-1
MRLLSPKQFRCVFAAFLLLAAPFVWARPTILVFGDSISAGYGLPADAGWVILLEKRLQARHYDYDVVNASISGETTSGGLYRIRQTLASHRPAIVIVELGGNDGLRGLSLEATRNNLGAIIAACREQGSRVLLVGMELPPNYGTTYTEKFRNIYKDVAAKYQVPLLPFLLEGMADQRKNFQADGIHPTAEAQPVLLENVWKKLAPMLKAKRPSKAGKETDNLSDRLAGG